MDPTSLWKRPQNCRTQEERLLPEKHNVAILQGTTPESQYRFLHSLKNRLQFCEESRGFPVSFTARSTCLSLVRKRLDEAVVAGYGWQSGLRDEEILSRLLALDLARAR